MHYTVQSGDTLWLIAQRFDRPRAIARGIHGSPTMSIRAGGYPAQAQADRVHP